VVDDDIGVEERKRRMRLLGFVGAFGDAFIAFVLWFTVPELGDSLYIITAVLIAGAVYMLWLMLVFLPRRMDRRQSRSAAKE
jgi:hypothetical protein